MKKKQNVPALRFQGFSGEWENFSLKDLSKEIIAGGDINKELIKDNGDFPVLGNALTNDGIVGYYDNEFRVKAPAVTITGRGDIGHAIARKVNFTPVIRLLSITTTHDVDFLANGINRSKFIAESTGIPQLTVPQVGKYKINIPSTKNEEERIGKCFVLLEKSVFEGNKKIQKLQQFRQAMLTKLFPREGEAEPELRFRGFSGKWVSKSFEELFSLLPTNNLARSDLNSEYGKIRDIHYGDILIKYNDLINVADKDLPFISLNMDVKTNALLRDGDIVIADTAEDMTAGKCVEIVNVGKESVVSGLHTIACRPLEPFATGFLGYFFNSHLYHNQLIPLMQGIKVTSISKNALKDTVVYFPSEFNEQKKIGQFFKGLDSFISLQQKKLERMQRLKAALLEKMFV